MGSPRSRRGAIAFRKRHAAISGRDAASAGGCGGDFTGCQTAHSSRKRAEIFQIVFGFASSKSNCMKLTKEMFRGSWAGLPVAWTPRNEFDEQVYRGDVSRCCGLGVP